MFAGNSWWLNSGGKNWYLNFRYGLRFFFICIVLHSQRSFKHLRHVLIKYFMESLFAAFSSRFTMPLAVYFSWHSWTLFYSSNDVLSRMIRELHRLTLLLYTIIHDETCWWQVMYALQTISMHRVMFERLWIKALLFDVTFFA